MHNHFSPLVFFPFFFVDFPPPPRGGGDSKRSTGHELIEHSTIPLASRVTLAPQTTNRRKNWWAWTQIEAGETVRPLRSAVRVVQVHLDSNLQRGRFRPCVGGLLAKAFGQVGIQASCMESHLHCSIQ